MDKIKLKKMLREKRIAVFMGGASNEREVSLATGQAIIDSLARMGIKADKVDFGAHTLSSITPENLDMAVLALHGRYGEDGCVQGALEIAGVPYTGSGVASSAMAMSKTLTKLVCKSEGITTPAGRVYFRRNFDPAKTEMKTPVVVKPANGGSSLNVTICAREDEIIPAIEAVFADDDEALVEDYIDGALITVGIVGRQALPAIEIEAAQGFYDYESKYTPGKTIYHIPARLDKETLEQAEQITMRMHEALRCRGVSRSELIVDRSETVWFIELNTIPGMTETSLLPKAASAMGISFDDMVLAMLEDAIEHDKN